jgi:hypothetical protein
VIPKTNSENHLYFANGKSTVMVIYVLKTPHISRPTHLGRDSSQPAVTTLIQGHSSLPILCRQLDIPDRTITPNNLENQSRLKLHIRAKAGSLQLRSIENLEFI